LSLLLDDARGIAFVVASRIRGHRARHKRHRIYEQRYLARQTPHKSGLHIIPNQIEPGRRRKRRQLLNKFNRFEYNVGSSVAPAALEPIQQPAR